MSYYSTRQPRVAFSAFLVGLFLSLSLSLSAVTTTMEIWSGSDGVLNTISMDGNTIYQSAEVSPDVYTSHVYAKRPTGVNFTSGATLYMDVVYKDLGGSGKFNAQYNATANNYQSVGFYFNSSVHDTGVYKTAVFRLDSADLKYAQNGGCDLRIQHDSSQQLHIKEIIISDSPTAEYLAQTAFLGPYTGPAFNGDTQVDASTFGGKVYCGYQGWFRAPGDMRDAGWGHYGTVPGGPTFDQYPDMTELTAAEKYPVVSWTYPDGSQAHLFSSDNYRTVLRHFQWMQTWGIDGVALQRFTNGVGDVEGLRVMSFVREAAIRTGRVFFIEYDMSGTSEATVRDVIANDWIYLHDTMQITQNSAYVHHDGKPVVGVFGFYEDRYASTAEMINMLDFFQNPGPYQSFFLGAGAWHWDRDFSAAWKNLIYRMDAWQPWNAGHTTGTNPNYVTTSYWPTDMALLAANAPNLIFMPEMWPGFSWDNLKNLPLGSSNVPRLQGELLWRQFTAATALGVQTAFVGMFDEIDEATQIFKATDVPPTQPYMITNEGLPSDCYLCFTALGTAMIKGEIPYTDTKPDCASMTKPSIPEMVAPLENGTVAGPDITFTWTQAFSSVATTATISYYELDVDGVISSTTSLSDVRSLGAGAHTWRIRAVNSLGHNSGWSLKYPFTVTGAAFTNTHTPTVTSTVTPAATRTPFAVPGCIEVEDYMDFYDTTVGNDGGQYRTDDVDIENCAEGGYNIGFIADGEWLEFQVDIAASGTYDLSVRSARDAAPAATIQILIDSSPVTAVENLPVTGDWQAWETTIIPGLSLSEGVHTLRFVYVTASSNLNWICLNPAATATPSASPSNTALPTETSTPTRTATFTPSVTRTVTRTRTQTPQNTATLSFTDTVTPGNTETSTPTWTATWTRTQTPQNTATLSFTNTVTPGNTETSTTTLSITTTQTPFPSATPSITETSTATTTVVQSATSSPTISASPTIIVLSWTPSPDQSFTATATRSSTEIPTATETASPTVTITSSNTPLATETVTGTISPSITETIFVSETETPTISATPTDIIFTWTVTPDLSPTSTETVVITETLTSSPVNTETFSPTETAIESAIPSVTASPVDTAVDTPLPSATASPVNTMTATPVDTALSTATHTATLTFTPVDTAVISPTFTETVFVTRTVTPGGPLPTLLVSATQTVTPDHEIDPEAEVLEVSAVPNPNPVMIAVKLKGRAESLELKIYTKAFTVVSVIGTGPLGPGWVQIPLLDELAEENSGLLYYKVCTGAGGSTGKSGKMMILK